MSIGEVLSLAMLPAACLILLTGYPAAFTLGGVAVAFASAGWLVGAFDPLVLSSTSLRVFGLMSNATLIAIPFFIFMGLMLERSQLAQGLLSSVARALGNRPGGLSLAVAGCGALMAASTGVAGASIMTLGLMALPLMLRAGYDRSVATGVIAASGTLGQIIPPSIALVILADTISASHQQAQLSLGNFAPDPISLIDLFAGALLPGLLLVLLYGGYLFTSAHLRPQFQPGVPVRGARPWWIEAWPLLTLILLVLGSIFTGAAAPGEAGALGAAGAVVLALIHKKLDFALLEEVALKTVVTTGMIFMLIIGASMFSLVFRELGGAALAEETLTQWSDGPAQALWIGMTVIFVLGFFLEFIEIVVLIVPVLATPLLMMGTDPVWLAVMIAVNLQCSFLTPPLGVALFYVRAIAPKEVSTLDIYKGAIPFIGLQLVALALVAVWPPLATALPAWIGS